MASRYPNDEGLQELYSALWDEEGQPTALLLDIVGPELQVTMADWDPYIFGLGWDLTQECSHETERQILEHGPEVYANDADCSIVFQNSDSN